MRGMKRLAADAMFPASGHTVRKDDSAKAASTV
jgi:hypothetical protein